MSSKKPTTLRDIAEAVGVDVSAVSRVLNNSRTGSRVSETTRQSILDTAKAMRYQPNALARNLDGRRIGMFGVVLGSINDLILHPYTGIMLQGVVDGATEASCQPILFTTSWDEAEASVEVFCDRRADGLIVFSPPEHSTLITQVMEHSLPVVGFDLSPGRYNCPQVGLDERKAFQTSVSHLMSLGHQRIAYVSATIGTYYSQYRQAVAESVMKELGVKEPQVHILPVELPIPSNNAAVRELLDSPNRPTAIFTYNDYVALAIMDAAKGMGIVVPDQLSVIGFDDLPIAALASPPLTTFYQPTRHMGRAAVRLLMSLINDKSDDPVPSQPLLFPPNFVIRKSTGPAPTK